MLSNLPPCSVEKATLDKWYRDWAYTLLPSADYKVNLPFANWTNDDYTLSVWGANPDNLWHHGPNTYQDGPKVHGMHNLWNNRRASTVRYIAVAGVKFDDAHLKQWSHRWLRDFVRYHVYPHGNNTFERYNGSGQRYSFADTNRGYHDRVLHANLYYQDPMVRDFYRGQNGMHPYRTTGNGTTDLNDSWAFPAPYLMWTGLEGKVWPYPND